TVGGTGKTPLVAHVARILNEDGARACILTRGYKRENPQNRVLVSDGERILADAGKAGDEPFELACKLIGVSAIVADRNRVEAGNWARENLGATAFVLDDAFQHRRARRDLDIVCIDATNPFGNGKILPAGILREPLSGLKRAGAVVVTRANLVEAKQVADLKSRISEINPQCEIFVSENKISGLITLKEFTAKAAGSETPIAESGSRREENQPKTGADKHGFENENRPAAADGQLTTDNYSAFCALGNPESFFEQLRREKFHLGLTEAFRDHHRYTQRDIDELERKAEANGAQSFLTTAKDAVKLKDLQFNLPCYVAESELIFDDEKGFRKLIVSAARKKSAAKGHERDTKKI
ncbi:MAG TPA: tetraacyldisaccharide 4'-kinase, partial [Pyrinomonadaceae bacterium]|nr:tetraacyldisaccharide 4'-kinase [Pyrinomonadaceae bacterium]